MRLTASKVGLAQACGYWLTPGVQLPSLPPGASSVEGTRVHDLIEHDDGEPTDEPAVLTARKYIASIGNRPMSKEPAYGWNGGNMASYLGIGREVYSNAPDGAYVVAGTVDLLTFIAPGRLRVTDWKNGERGCEKAEAQLRTLAALALLNTPAATECEMHAVWLQGDGVPVDYGTMSVMEADGWLEGVRALGPTEPNPGDHCRALYCPLEGRCPAYGAVAELLPATALTSRKNPMVAAIDDEETARAAVLMLEMVDSLVETKRAELRAYVATMHEGRLPLGNGKAYGPVMCKGRSSIDAKAALELAEKLGASKDDLGQLVKLGASYEQWRVTGRKTA